MYSWTWSITTTNNKEILVHTILVIINGMFRITRKQYYKSVASVKHVQIFNCIKNILHVSERLVMSFIIISRIRFRTGRKICESPYEELWDLLAKNVIFHTCRSDMENDKTMFKIVYVSLAFYD